jgi:excisionase family DNA binding protein
MNETQQAPILLLTPRQAAKALAISERTLATYTKSGALPVVRIGACVRYSPDDLRDWIRRATEKKFENGQNCT